MSDFTFATVIVTDADRAAAQAAIGSGFFTASVSPTGAAPATHWISSGAFSNDELNQIVNSATWQRLIYFGEDWQAAIAAEGLLPVPADAASGE